MATAAVEPPRSDPAGVDARVEASLVQCAAHEAGRVVRRLYGHPSRSDRVPAVQTVCVFCGSRCGRDPSFLAAAHELGREVGARGLTLVYGGAKVGLMGAVAAGALAANGRVIGIIPRALVTKEVAHDGLTELRVTESMQERKNQMIALSDAFVAMPGGFGTYDELFEALTLAQLGLHAKPSGLLDTKGFFAPLLKLLAHTIDEGFAAAHHADLFVSEPTPAALLDRLAAWVPTPPTST